WLDAGMPFFFPDALKNYLNVANLTQEKELALSSTRCGYTASYCLSAPGTNISSSTGDFISQISGTIDEDAFNNGELDINSSYRRYSGTSMAAPHVAGAAAVLMQRFPYMTAAQISDVLKTTATIVNKEGKRIHELSGWGMLNLKDAIDGPKMFITEDDIPTEFYIPGSYTDTQFVANITGIGGIVEKGTTVERVCDTIECAYDFWSNDISGHGGLTKTGRGMLELTGKNSTYQGPTLVEQGQLQVSGGITSDVTVHNGATLSGNGTVGSLSAQAGAYIAPGNVGLLSTDVIGTLNVSRDVLFEKDSHYLVKISPNTEKLSDRSDIIYSEGEVTLKGGAVQAILELSNDPFSKQKVSSFFGQKYKILQTKADNAIKGQFTTASSNYLFVGANLSYQPDRVTLNINRNATPFVSVAKTANERAIAQAADKLNLGHPVYESILMSNTAAQAGNAFQQLSSGQIHTDIAAAQIDASRYLRDTLNTRLRQADGGLTSQNIKADQNGVWAQITSNWQRTNSNNEANGYRMSNYGVLLGADRELANDLRLGIATGFTRSSLRGGDNTSAGSDNVHLAFYGSKQLDALALRTGIAYSWHRFDTERSVAFGRQSDNLKAKYGAQTGQLFAEAAYGVNPDWLNLEPFANLSHVNFRNEGINEHGGAAALTGKKQSKNATFSTLGLRVNKNWQSQDQLTVGMYGELGWQHQFGNAERNNTLSFSNSEVSFAVNSVSAARNAAVIKAGTSLGINENTKLSLGYNGVLSSGHKDNGVFFNANWKF
ncbi:autotransporter domain-containing protein, partial [Xenorhabdus innexi]